MTDMPLYRAIILGAGKNIRGELPSAMVGIDGDNRLMDWLLAAFRELPQARIEFVGGYKLHSIMEQYPQVSFLLNENWQNTGPAASLALSSLKSQKATYVSYADIVFRPRLLQKMESLDKDLVLALDRQWRVRYDGRSRAEAERSEKVRVEQGKIVDIGRHVPAQETFAEFVGLMKVSHRIIEKLQECLADRKFACRATLPQVISYLLKSGISVTFVDVAGEWAELNAPQDLARFVLGTKAESLKRLQPLVTEGQIGQIVSFTHGQWDADKEQIIGEIIEAFNGMEVIVRSSALNEDSWLQSSAGAYKSIGNVPGNNRQALIQAIEEVIASYQKAWSNQVLVQKMLQEVTMSGVVMTRTPDLGAPYYVINFDNTTSRTDTVTSGTGNYLRTVFVHRDHSIRAGLPAELTKLMRAVRELESLVGHDSLDIEFAFTGVQLHILQVRPIVVANREYPIDDGKISAALIGAQHYFQQLQMPGPFVLGDTNQFSVMSDWNPAEIIGTKPKKLSFSLYRYLITDEVWALQRAEYGYRDVRPCCLLVDFLGHPYIDVRATFNSFVPAGLPESLARRLVNHYLQYLSQNPHLHDKVEFEVLYTCLTFDIDERMKRLSDAGFVAEELELIKNELKKITLNAFRRKDIEALDSIHQRLEKIISAKISALEKVYLLLEDAKRYGTPLFSHLARSAFVATSILRSLSNIGCISLEQQENFQASLWTVSQDIQHDAAQVASSDMTWQDFVDKYGHLRPGSYDITSPCYAASSQDYLMPMIKPRKVKEKPDPWNENTYRKINNLLQKFGLDIEVSTLENFMKKSIEGREYSKFIFTRNLSAALEVIAEFGEEHGLSREQMSHIAINDLLALRSAPVESIAEILRKLSSQGCQDFQTIQTICLPGQIVSEQDFKCFEQLKAEPNFVTRNKNMGYVISLSLSTPPKVDLSGKIVLIPNADPGFDWLFSRNIGGLITMYGGLNSHMAVRASEFQLPAAIGVGELIYEQITNAEIIELDCASRQIKIIR